MLPKLIITVHRVLISDPVVQVGLDIVIRLVLRVRVGSINFITISIFPLSVPASCIRSVDVVDVALLQIFAAGARAVFAEKMAMLPTHVHKADQSERHRDCGEAQEDVECVGFSICNVNIKS